jgi:hypothetical protein
MIQLQPLIDRGSTVSGECYQLPKIETALNGQIASFDSLAAELEHIWLNVE